MTGDPQDLSALIGPYVLGACSPEEAAEVRARMVVDPAFRREVESYAPAFEALLQEPAPSHGPDPATKARIMAVVREQASLFAAAEGEPVPDPPMEDPAKASTGPGPRRRAFARALRHPARIGALVAVLVAVVVGVSLLNSGGGTTGPGSERVTAQVVRDEAPAGRATLVVDDGRGRLELSGFPTAGAGRKYQVWLRTGNDAPRPTRVLFDVDAKGNGTAAIPDSLKGVDDVLVTSEPAAGSQAPTRDPVLSATVPA